MRRRLLTCLPALAAAIVAWAALGGGLERIEFVRVLGGPTRAGASASVLVGAWAIVDQRRVPVAGLSLRLVAGGAGGDVLASGVTDASGHLEARLVLPPDPSPPKLRVERAGDGGLLAEGDLALDVEGWRAAARREGGWLPGHTRGELAIELAVAAGVLAVPFEGRLIARVRGAPGGDAQPVAGAALELELTGAELAPLPALPVTDARGGVEVALRPREHAVSARLLVRSGARRGEWYGALPVLPGALSAELEGVGLRVRSPIERERAFVSLVSTRERLGGAVVELLPEPDGTASGRFEPGAELLARLRDEPTWAVVSSDDDKRSPAVVGWPLGAALAALPAVTFGVPDQVLLDGEARALRDLGARLSARRRGGSALLGAIAVLTGGLFWKEVRGRRRQPASAVPTRDGWFFLMALASIALGLGALAYFGALRR